MKYSANELRERVEVLELQHSVEGWEWAAIGRRYAGVELTGKSNLFSAVGIGARDAAVLLRDGPLTLNQALRWRGRHLFLTQITRGVRGWMDVGAAVVDVAPCRSGEVGKFPGVLTEKYLGHRQEEPMALNTLTCVLVTPKAVELAPGALVEVDGTPWPILLAHTLDPHKNEYEIARIAEP